MTTVPTPGVRPSATATPTAPTAPTAQDRTAVLDVIGATGLFPPDELGEVAAILDAYLDGTAGDDRWLVDRLDTGATAIRAVAYYAPERMADGTWNLYLLAVHPDQQGRGRGAALVRQVEQDLTGAGVRVLLIETSGVPEFAPQRAFYRGLGYHQEALIRDFYAPGDDKIVFWKALSPAGPAENPTGPAGAADGLRPARRDDLAALRALAEDFYREDGFGTSGGDLAAHLAHLVGSAAAHVVVVEDDGDGDDGRTLAGFAITTTSFGLEDGLIAELEDLYVTPARRSQGLAGRLIDDAAAWARARGCAALDVVVAPNGRDVSALHGYYQARGFTDDGRRLRRRDLR